MEKRKINTSQPSTILEVETKFKWHSEIGKKDCECGLRIYKISFNQAIVIVSELKDNPGRSITDEALTLIHLVCYKFGLNLTNTMWIEHYPEGYLKEEDTYDEIKLEMFDINSKRINKQRLEALLGVKL